MKQFLFYLLLLAFIPAIVPAQEQLSPRIIRKAAYADKTPPLREMTVILPGERKRAWKDGIIKNESVEMLPKNEAGEQPGIYESLQQTKGETKSRGPLVNVDGVGNVNGVYPPDTDGDVGPNHYFQMINLSFAIFSKTGARLYGPADNSTLWQGFIGPWTGTNDGDPIVIYDEDADRWVASQFAVELSNGKSYELVAVSATGDPLGEYYRYAFEFDHFNDYPKLGVWGDGYYCTFNFFSGQFIGSGVAAFERDKMLVGDPDANMVFFGYFQNKFSLQPSDFDGGLPPEGAPAYIATTNNLNNKQLEIYEFSVDWDNPANSTYQLSVTLNPGYFNANVDGIPQPGTNNRLDVLSQMLMFRLAYRNFGTYETMLANHTVKVGNRAGIKWYELRKDDTTNWYIYQQGVYAPDDDLHRWMGSMAMNADGTIALGFSVSSSSHFPSIRYTGRTTDAPLGEMNFEEIEAVTGTSNQSSISRWGDYANMSVDPADDTTFWFTTEYCGGGWKTRIISFNFAPLMPPVVSAGEDASVCQDTLFRAYGSVANAKSYLWTTTGDGILPNPQNLSTVYFRGNGDLAKGEFWLTLTAQGYGEGMVTSDSVHVEIVFRPIVNAGNDTTIHLEAAYQANAQVSNYENLLWSTAGDGIFSPETSLETIYTPGEQDKLNRSVKLTLIASPFSPCSFGASDNLILTLDPTIGIAEKQTLEKISVSPNPSSGKFTITANDIKLDATISILNSGGETVFTEHMQPGDYTRAFDLRYQPAGIYLVQITTGNTTVIEKVVIQ
jgi:hypothetical protein